MTKEDGRMKRATWVLASLALLLGSVGQAKADMIYEVSGSGSDGALAAEADFSIGNGTITVVLKNLQTNLGSAGQAISGLTFTASGLQSPAGLSLVSYSGDAVNVNADGSITDFGTTTYSGSILSNGHWGAFSSNGMTALTGGQPDHMILGPPKYATNGNVVGKGQFNPWFENSATFVLNAPGVTTDSTISNVDFFFGTGPDSHLNGVPKSVVTPAPPSVILLGVGAVSIAGFAALSRRRRRLAA
jgi:hypothetical protein